MPAIVGWQLKMAEKLTDTKRYVHVTSRENNELKESVNQQLTDNKSASIDHTNSSLDKPSRIPIRTHSNNYCNSKRGSDGAIGVESYSTDSLDKLCDSCFIHADTSCPKVGYSKSECLCGSTCSPVTCIRENVTSRRRFEINHSGHDLANGSYRTPTERKNDTIRKLQKCVKNLREGLNEKNCEISTLRENLDRHESLCVKYGEEREAAVQKMDIKSLRATNADLRDKICTLEGKIELLKETLATKEKDHEATLLQMYQKGMKIAQRQREEEIGELVSVNANHPLVTMQELINKLTCTEKSLSEWQSLRRQEAYFGACFPQTEPEATLRFLRDSFYHYLTGTNNSDDHLRAMIRIFNFTEVQKIKISKAMLKGKKK